MKPRTPFSTTSKYTNYEIRPSSISNQLLDGEAQL